MPERNAAEEWARRMGEPVPTAQELEDFLKTIAAGAPHIYIPRSVLTERGEEVLQFRFGSLDGLMRTQREVGEMLGRSRWAVGREERRVIANLKMFRQQHSP